MRKDSKEQEVKACNPAIRITEDKSLNYKSWIRKHLAILGLVILAMNVFVWFVRGLPVGFSDGGLQTMFLHPSYLLRQSMYAWSENQLGGVPTYSNISLAPLEFIATVLHWLRIPLYIQQAAIWYLIELAALLSCRKWLKYVFKGSSNSEVISTVGAIFYTFNIMNALVYWFWDKLNITTIAIVPIIFLAIEIVLTSTLLRGAIAMSIAMFVSSSVFLDGIVLLPVVLLSMCYALIRVIQVSSEYGPVPKLMGRVMGSVAVGSVTSSWVILPFIASAGTYYSNANGQINASVALQNATAWSSWSGLVRLLPFGDQASGAWLYKLPSWRSLYGTPVFWALAGVVLLVLGSGIVSEIVAGRRLLFSTLFVFGLVSQAGAKGPVGFLVNWIVLHVPYGHVFRTPWRSLAPVTVMGGAALFGLGIARIRRFVSLRWNVTLANSAMVAIIVLSCGIYVFPLWTGQIVSSPIRQRGAPVSSYVDIPSSYSRVARYLMAQPGTFNVLGVPLSPTSYYTSEWQSGYDGSDQRWLLFEHPTISFTSGGAFPAVQTLQRFIERSSQVNFDSLVVAAGRLSCGFIVVDGYMLTSRGGYYGQQLHDPEYYIRGLESVGLRPVMSAGLLTVFKVPSADLRPMVTAENLTTGVVSSSIKVLHASPVESKATLTNTQGQWLIGFHQNYSSKWAARVIGEAGGRQYVLQPQHIMMDGFANGWIVNLPMASRSAVIEIFYSGQRYINIGIVLSIVSWLVLLVLWFVKMNVHAKDNNGSASG